VDRGQPLKKGENPPGVQLICGEGFGEKGDAHPLLVRKWKSPTDEHFQAATRGGGWTKTPERGKKRCWNMEYF